MLERHGLALAIEKADGVQVMGVLRDDERRAWEATYRLARVSAGDVADDDRASVDEAQRCARCAVLQHRLVMRVDDEYVAVGSGAWISEALNRPLAGRVGSSPRERRDPERGPMVTS